MCEQLLQVLPLDVARAETAPRDADKDIGALLVASTQRAKARFRVRFPARGKSRKCVRASLPFESRAEDRQQPVAIVPARGQFSKRTCATQRNADIAQQRNSHTSRAEYDSASEKLTVERQRFDQAFIRHNSCRQILDDRCSEDGLRRPLAEGARDHEPSVSARLAFGGSVELPLQIAKRIAR